ncbi:hypothetical protein SKAU_G00092810 [Synaphobranchus kaupii]|uniref:Uncharacterized protein n=1 Tax=Synaphobranchus kaupii TaxID=118154 RepID=A0A9Q1FXV1_SYNKA|nr:hypothetical protein SKAU_G00092810 [Synaphobranchus kaupii]
MQPTFGRFSRIHRCILCSLRYPTILCAVCPKDSRKMADESGDLVFKWSKENTGRLIQLRSKYDTLFTGQKNTANHGWRVVLEEMELTALDCKYPGSGEGTENGKPTAATWPWFALMDEVLGQRPSISPPVLIASIQEDSPGPSNTQGQGQDEDQNQQAGSRKRKAGREDEWLQLIKEDIAFQRECEARRVADAKERDDRLFSLLEKIVNK